MSNFPKALNRISVTILSVFALLILVLGMFNPSLNEMGIFLFSLLYCCAFVPLSLVSVSWLLWQNRDQLTKTWAWWGIQLVFVASMALCTVPLFGFFFFFQHSGYTLCFVGRC